MSASGTEPSFCLPSARWRRRAVPVIGLTGTIGSGKSQVAALLGRRGAHVIDADSVGHEVLDEPEITRQVVERFGSRVLDATAPGGAAGDSRVDRRALGAIVFADHGALHDLEAILHPRMRERFEAIIDRLSLDAAAPAVVLDAAILLEAGWDSLCDLVVFVDAPLPLRQERVARGRGWSAEALQVREDAQWSCARKRARADLVLENDSSIEGLEQLVDRLFLAVTGGGPGALIFGGSALFACESQRPPALVDGECR
jgi:dephospho-CoA kinase